MPDYDIYVLGESDVTVTGGNGQLDGVTGGNGSNLNGATITLNSNAWAPVAITDDDANFQDSDGSQRLNGAQTIDGVSYNTNSVVEAEYGFTVTDGTNSWTLIGFNVNNSAPAYGTVEGLAFIGGAGDFPPVGVPLTVTSTFEGPNFAATDYSTPICLVSGTMVETADGPVPIETVSSGMLVKTRDHGLQPVRWVGKRTVQAMASFAPVRINAGVIGNANPLWVSQQHRVLVEGWRTELLFGQDCMLVPAVHLVDNANVQLVQGGTVTYVHLLFDRHEMIETEGCWTESLFPGDMAMDTLLPQARAEICALFPELDRAKEPCAKPCTSHPVMRRHEAALYAGHHAA